MVEWTRATPWRQGHLLSIEAAQALELLPSAQPEDSIVLVISHHCDLAQPPTVEPFVEVIVGRKIANADGNYTNAKTARKLHLEFEGEPAFWAEFVSTSKKEFAKQLLTDYPPLKSARLPARGLATLQRWLAMRYQRAAFPDEFERRLKETHELDKKISKAVKPHGDLITAVLFDVDEGAEISRQNSDDAYTLDIMLLHSVESDFAKAEAAAKQAMKAIQTAFESKLKINGQWRDIELRHCDVLSEDGLTYRVFSQMRRWNLDHLSLGADPQHPVAAS